MHHRLTNFNAGGEPIRQEPPCLALQNREQCCGGGAIRLIIVKGTGQLAFQPLCHRLHRHHICHAYNDAKWAKDFMRQLFIRQPYGAGRHKDRRRGRTIIISICVQQRCHPLRSCNFLPPLRISRRNPLGQHRLCTLGLQRLQQFCLKQISLRAIKQNNDTGVGAELPGPHSQRSCPALCDICAPR
jgi:hypothetical protein